MAVSTYMGWLPVIGTVIIDSEPAELKFSVPKGSHPMLSVYVAGNYDDVDTAIQMAASFEEFIPFIPQIIKAHGLSRWHEQAQFFLSKCDCVLALHDQCIASIYDMKLAREQNIPVFTNYLDLMTFSREGL